MSYNKSKLIKFCRLLICTIIFISLAPLSYGATEHQMARSFMRSMRSSLNIIDDPLVQNYIQKLGQRLVNNTDDHDKKFHFFVVTDDSINAFSGPDGNVGINSGIFLATNSESELASVLAHEITHATQKHILRAQDEQKGLILPEIATTAAIIAASMASKSNSMASATSGAVMAGMAGSSQYAVNTIRSFEWEADRIGIKVLYLSGFDPIAMPDFFERIARYNLSSVNGTPSMLLDHPLTAERIADARNRAMQYRKHKITINPDYYLIKARLKVLTSETDYRINNYFKNHMLDKSKWDRDAAQYGYALFLVNSSKISQAEDNINSLLKTHPNNVIYQLALAEIKTKVNKNNVAMLQRLLSTNPDSYPVIIEYAETLIQAKRYQSAEDFLKAQTQNYADDPKVYDLLALAQGQNGHFKDAYRTRAKLFSLLGYDKAAQLQMEQAGKN